MSPEEAMHRFVWFGLAGWLLENALYGSRYSKAFGGVLVPFLPVYGTGGVLIGAAAPLLVDVPAPARVAVYAATFSGVESLACSLDRAAGPSAWDYGDGACVDVPHAIGWGLLGLVAEQVR